MTAAPRKTAGAGAPRVVRQALSGWGRYPVAECLLARPERMRDAVPPADPCIPRGRGRSYGDAAVSSGHTVLLMERLNRFRAFAPRRGVLTVEAGVTVGEVQRMAVPRGWTLAVTPGTRHATVGGCVAADVHGKNHHGDGSIRSFVDWIELLGPDGTVCRCSPKRNAELFRWTLGGMGLTGVVLRAALRLRPVESGWIRQRTIACDGLAQAVAAIEETLDWTYSVAWIDCLASGGKLGRSLLMLGEHATREELDAAGKRESVPAPRRGRLTVPIDLPGWVLNRASIGAFNALYYRRGATAPELSFVDYERYFYPLDAIGGWNRLYGKRGFAQFQCVLPLEAAKPGLEALLRETAGAGKGSFLAVLKRFGPQEGPFSFPLEGYTLTLDVPISGRALALLERLDAITVDHGGRFYLAKDSRMSRETLSAADPRTADFRKLREARGLAGHFASAQSERLGL